MNCFAKTTVAAATAAALMAGALTASTTTASAGSLNVTPAVATTAATTDADANLVKVGWRHRHRRGYAGPAAAGLVFGLATGAIIANSYRGPRCYWTVIEKENWDRYGNPYFVKKRVKVCD